MANFESYMMKTFLLLCVLVGISIFSMSCNQNRDTATLTHDSARVSKIYNTDIPVFPEVQPITDSFSLKDSTLITGKLTADSLVAFAKTLKGIPYKYASTNPAEGFDCSGFITYVFNYFKINVPRSSYDFTNLGKEINITSARKGDLILFTGTDSTETKVGHMGIVINNTDTLKFIHSSSGKANGVTESPLNQYYKGRFVKVIRIF